MKIIILCTRILFFLLLTILTQVGGLIYIGSLLFYPLIQRKTHHRLSKSILKIAAFIFPYLASTFFLIPLIAKPFGGRVPLPVNGNLKPLNIITCLLNRHYVNPSLKEAASAIAVQMKEQFPGTTVNYLDASFPFFHHFPLVPHLSHNDGKKLDLAFFYLDETGKPINTTPSVIGYGAGEPPRANEINTAEFCERKGYWQYSLLNKIIPRKNSQELLFDSTRTKALAIYFANNPSIEKIFIEPHLKARLHLTSFKFRFHGCQAVRHDDHLHVQVK